MKVHVVMPVVNCLDLTRAAIESIHSKDKALIHLVDNASTDGTQDWGKLMNNSELLGNKVLNYIRNDEPRGVAASWNQGIARAFEDPECKYVLVVNNDVILHEKTLDHLRAFMDKTRYLMVTGDNVKDRMSVEVMVQQELPMPFTDFDTWEIKDWRAEGPDFSCFLINRDTIEILGWFDEHFLGAYCEDQDYHARLDRARRWGEQYGNPDPKRCHAKRLSTAPYYHFASQTIAKNYEMKQQIQVKHGNNMNYYIQKWGGEHPWVMDGNGNMTPFGDATKNWTTID